ncbi:hypothetical protein Vi05172_g11210 [Venturia inaequalis]|nr:hypothetical protein Vi05172_g11210 [Venturia inaequalis]
MTKFQYTRKDYERMQARLNPALEELRTEIRETLDQHEDRSHLWTRLKEGWELTEEWLGSEDKWPTIMTGEGLKECKDRGKKWPRSTKVLYVTGEEFKGLTKREMNAFAYIVIKGGYEGELGHHLESLRDSFEKTPKARVDVQNYTPRNIADLASPVYDGGLAKHSASRLDDMLVALGDPKPLMQKHYRGEPWKKSLPWNWLNLNGNLFDDIDAPTDAHECLQALNDIVDDIQPWEVSASTKETFGKPSDDGDVQACLRFNILGEKGTFSGAHVDILGGTWLLCLEGVKLWWAFTDTSALDRKYSPQLAAFAEQGVGWNPGAGQNGMQLIPLEAGDYLLMMPGNITPHAPFSMTDCLMTGVTTLLSPTRRSRGN